MITLLTSRGGNRGPKARPIRRHMAMFVSNHVQQISLYILMSRSWFLMTLVLSLLH